MYVTENRITAGLRRFSCKIYSRFWRSFTGTGLRMESAGVRHDLGLLKTKEAMGHGYVNTRVTGNINSNGNLWAIFQIAISGHPPTWAMR